MLTRIVEIGELRLKPANPADGGIVRFEVPDPTGRGSRDTYALLDRRELEALRELIDEALS